MDEKGPFGGYEHWYVMNAYTKNEGRVLSTLGSCKSLEHYMPMRYAIRNYYGRPKRELVPLIPHTFFMRGTYEAVEAFQKDFSYIGFATTMIDGRRTSMKVPDVQMTSFMKVASQYEDNLTYYHPDEIELNKGDYVRIVGGRYDGATGIMLRLKGKRGKRLVACIPQIMAVATTCIEPEFVQKITQEEYMRAMQEGV